MTTPNTQQATSVMNALVERWQARAHDALPADAMLINKHIRELRWAIEEQDRIEADMAIHRWKQRGGPARDNQARAVKLEREQSEAMRLGGRLS